jgi:hypothetical protein
MKFTSKEYNIAKTKKYFQSNNLFIFFNGINLNSDNWILIEQKLKKINFSYYKIFNTTSKKILQNSIHISKAALVSSITFLFKPISTFQEITKDTLLNSFEPMLFTILALKLNNKIYSKDQLKKLFSFKYKENKLLLFHFGVVNIKLLMIKKSK